MNNIKVEPLGITQINWNLYIKFTQNILGVSPTRGIDAAHIDLNHPSAFIATIPIGNKPHENLADKYNLALGLMSFSFIIKAELQASLKLARYTKELDAYPQIGDNDVLIILNGTLKDWIEVIRKCSRSSVCKEVRYIINCCYIYFKRGGFSRIWDKYDEITLKDGSIILEEKKW